MLNLFARSTTLTESRRLPGLDTLRATAITWVLLFHAEIFDLIPEGHRLIEAGWMGVDLFFALSGYLIGGQLFRPMARGEQVSYHTFFLRRALRTLPAYLAVVSIYFLFPGIREGVDIQPLWQFLAFTENMFVTVETPKAFSHVWSLCVEEQFYVLLPLAVLGLSKRPTASKVGIAALSILVFGMAIRAWAWLSGVSSTPFDIAAEPNGDNYIHLIYYPTWSRLDGLLAGVMVAAAQTFRSAQWRRFERHANGAVVLGLLGVAASMATFRYQVAGLWAAIFGYPLIAASMAALVAGASVPTSALGRLKIPGVGALAAGSYSLYLSHKLVYKAVKMGWIPTFYAGPHAKLATALVVAAIVGVALHRSVERPFLTLRNRWTGSRRQHGLPDKTVEADGERAFQHSA